MKSQAHLLMSRNGKVGGIDKEDHHQQKHAVDGRMEFEKLTRLKRYATLIG